MAEPNPADSESNSVAVILSTDELAAKVVHKRYEGLMGVRNKAVKGKGAWYWTYLEPILVHIPDSEPAKAVKLRCSLCEAVFSASNPSRTATEHLKKGACPKFAASPKPISSVPPPSSSLPYSTAISPSSQRNHRKRNAPSCSPQYGPPPLAIVDPSRFITPDFVRKQQLVLSGGKEDFGALAMFEDSVKKLKAPPEGSPKPALSKLQVDSAVDFLSDWVFECFGSVSFSSLEHPKFREFLNHVGLPAISKRELAGSRLDAKYEEAKAESEAKIHDALFFQIASNGWKCKENSDLSLVHLGVNLPNGTSVFRRAIFAGCDVPSKYAEDVLWDTVTEICGSSIQQCAGIVSDRFKTKALRNLENQHQWMVNLCCQYEGINSLIRDFWKELPLFKNAARNCIKLANFMNDSTRIRHIFRKHQMQEYGHACLLRVPSLHNIERSDFTDLCTMVDDIVSSARALQLVLLDETYQNALMEEETAAREVDEMFRNPLFWNEVEAVNSLVKLIKAMALEIETEKPRVGHCLPLWEEVKVKVKAWCSRFQVVEGPVEKVIDKRFRKNYHPSWAAALILDPLYLVRDLSGKYIPPFKCLTSEQEKDVDRLITRLVSREEAHIVLMELMKWRTEGLDPVYAQAVQLKQRDPNTGRMKIVNPQSSRLVWETYLTEFRLLGKVAVRLIFLHATSCCFKCKWSTRRSGGAQTHSRVQMNRAQKLMFIAAHSKMEKRDLPNDGGREMELFALGNDEDDVLNEVFVETSSV